MEKDLTVSLLLDAYGGLLTERQRDMMEQYYEEDLSLAEIDDNCGVTRQGVRDAVRRTEKILRGYEQSLGMVARYQAVCLLADELEAAAEDNAPPQRLRALAARLRELA